MMECEIAHHENRKSEFLNHTHFNDILVLVLA